MNKDAQSLVVLKRPIVVFGITYLALLLVFGIGFSLVGIKSNHGANAAALLCAGVITIQDFVKKYSRNFSRREKVLMTVTSAGIDFVYQVGGLALITFTRPEPMTSLDKMSSLAIGVISVVLLFAIVCHVLLLAYVYGSLSNKLSSEWLKKKAQL